ncbi:hypothetical protein SUDANB121_04720 [Nocardiopsis dassonvillei]
MDRIDAAGMAALTGRLLERAAFHRAELVLGVDGVLAVVDAGDGTGRSCVWNAEEVRLLGEVPLAGALGEWYPPEDDRPLHVVVRTAGGHLHLGRGRHVRSGSHLAPGDSVRRLTEFAVELCAPLDRDLLERVRPAEASDPPGLSWLEGVQDDPLGALEGFATGWYPAEGPPEAGGRPDLPRPLARFHRLAAARPLLLGGQNFLRPPQELDPASDGPCVLGTENQGGFSWELRRGPGGFGDDPAVWFVDGIGEPVTEEEPLSRFLLQFTLYEAAVRAEYGALAVSASAEEAGAVARALRPVPLRPFLAPRMPTRLYAAPGLVAAVSASDDRFDVWAGASHRSALAPLRGLPVDWERLDD